MKLNKKIFSYFNKHGATILSIAAAAGVVLTAVETAKATTKAQSLIDMNKAEPMTKKEIVKDCWKFYVPAMAITPSRVVSHTIGTLTTGTQTRTVR